MRRIAIPVLWILVAACAAPPPLAEADRREEQLAAARQALAANPGDRDAAIWVGRRLGYLGRFDEAVAVYTAALQRLPDDPYLLRHRGHRQISLRRFDRAVEDLTRAAARCRTEPDSIEPDGQPTPGRPPHSTLHFNVHYHLGLAHFLRGDFAAAERAWLDCLAVVTNDEAHVAVAHWLWSVRMRLRNPAGAAAVVASITPDLDVVENRGYHQLCLCYAGRLAPDAIRVPDGSAGAAVAFGLAHRALVSEGPAAARDRLAALARLGGAAFGVIAAEAELGRRTGTWILP